MPARVLAIAEEEGAARAAYALKLLQSEGEQTNALVGYLAAISRKLEDPLAVMVRSSSAAGKSSLLDADEDIASLRNIIDALVAKNRLKALAGGIS